MLSACFTTTSMKKLEPCKIAERVIYLNATLFKVKPQYLYGTVIPLRKKQRILEKTLL